jgi:hypothetical protein
LSSVSPRYLTSLDNQILLLKSVGSINPLIYSS